MLLLHQSCSSSLEKRSSYSRIIWGWSVGDKVERIWGYASTVAKVDSVGAGAVGHKVEESSGDASTVAKKVEEAGEPKGDKVVSLTYTLFSWF